MRLKRFLNVHTILLLVVLLTITGVVYRFFHWGQRIDLDTIFKNGEEAQADTYDLFLPVIDSEGNIVATSEDISTIVCFGNAPFADDRDSEDNLANMIAKRTGATVYNCSISGSYLAAEDETIDAAASPYDAYNFYWLTHLTTKGPVYDRCAQAASVLGEDTPPEAQEVYDTLWNLDFNKVDVVVIMYDASDYLAGHEMYNDLNNTDIQQFTGNLEAGIELLQSNFPLLRIIVMSPAYAYAVDEDGNYISSDMYTYGWDVLSTYAIKEFQSCNAHSVTFVDHLYGTITEDNAKEYLIDNLHINKAGREKIADRFVKALYHYRKNK